MRRWAPFYSLWRAERKRTAKFVKLAEDLTLELAVAKAHRDIARSQAQNALEELIDSEARCRRLEEQLTFIAGYRLDVYADEEAKE